MVKLEDLNMHPYDVVARIADRVGRYVGHQSSRTHQRFGIDAAAIPAAEREQSELHRLFYENDGPIVHKWRNYLGVYHRHLARFRGQPVRLLEIGVSKGGSLALWRKYLGPAAIIYGVDVNKECADLNGRDGQVRIGSQADRGFMEGVVAEMGGVDIAIDDGSHIASHQKASFDTLFPLLSPEGVYMCEDLHTSYWSGRYEGGYRRPSTFIEIVKAAIDDMHIDFHGRRPRVLDASRCIDGIHFYNSIVVIERRPQPAPVHILVGTEMMPRGTA